MQLKKHGKYQCYNLWQRVFSCGRHQTVHWTLGFQSKCISAAWPKSVSKHYVYLQQVYDISDDIIKVRIFFIKLNTMIKRNVSWAHPDRANSLVRTSQGFRVGKEKSLSEQTTPHPQPTTSREHISNGVFVKQSNCWCDATTQERNEASRRRQSGYEPLCGAIFTGGSAPGKQTPKHKSGRTRDCEKPPSGLQALRCLQLPLENIIHR